MRGSTPRLEPGCSCQDLLQTSAVGGASLSAPADAADYLVDHYVATLDSPSSFDEDRARSLFTEDVRLEQEIAVLEGIEEVAAAHRMVMARWERTLHFSANHCIEFDGEHAHLTARPVAIHVHPGENPPDALIAANLSDADVVHTSNGWRFERFAPRTIWKTGQPPAAIEANQQ